MADRTIKIGGASGYWGESPMATPQFLNTGVLDYIVYDYLSEITMSILARAKAKGSDAGYAKDFVTSVLQPNLANIAKSGVKIISNAGGVNPEACGVAAQALIDEFGLDLRVAVITGDDLLAKAVEISKQNPCDMFSGEDFPDTGNIVSINAYLGAFPIAKALSMGADIVITGRCVDSALTLGACIHEFGWANEDYDHLASGSLAGHILECGPQATGGNFTDWRDVGDIAEIGYPIAEISPDGSFYITKPDRTTGLVNVGVVSEQMLYEIGDPQAYLLPDVVCDFSDVKIHQAGSNRVNVSPARGSAAPDAYKTCATFQDGYRTGTTVTFYGFDAVEKAKSFADAAFERASKTLRRMNAAPFTQTSVEILGAESQFGAFAEQSGAREIIAKIAAKHPSQLEGSVLLKEIAGLGLASPPGLSGFQGGRAKPSPVVRLFSFLTTKQEISVNIELNDASTSFADKEGKTLEPDAIIRPAPPPMPLAELGARAVPLIKLAWGRSGDKGDKANIGIIARHPKYLPYIWAALDEQAVADRFAHFIEGGADASKVKRFFLPGSNAMNFVIDRVLGGGGVASIRNDPQGKGFAQILLAQTVPIQGDIAEQLL